MGSHGMWFGPVLPVSPVSEISIWQGVQLQAVHWFLVLLSPSLVFLRTALLFGARPCPGDSYDPGKCKCCIRLHPKQSVSQGKWWT